MGSTLRGCLGLARLVWRTDPRRMVLSVVLMLGQAVSLPLSAPALAALTDAALARDPARAVVAGAFVGVLAITSLTLGHFAYIAYFELGELNSVEMDRRLIDLANGSAGLAHHERPEYADRFHVLRQEMNRLGWMGIQAMLSILGLGVAIVLTGILLAGVDRWLLLLPLAAVPPLVAGRYAEVILSRAREEAAGTRRLARHLFRLATDGGPAKELRVCGLRDELLTRHAALWKDSSRILDRAERRAAGLRVLGQLVFAAGYVAATLVVVRDVVTARRGAGDVVLVVTLASQVNQQVTAAVALVQELQRTASAMNTFHWAAALVARDEPPAPDLAVPDRIRHGIRLRDVSFTYPGTDREILGAVDLFLPAGSTVAIVGENGAGKTTLVKLLCRFYEPTTGTLEVDGSDLRRLPLDSWRSRIAAGFQDFVRFEFLARENVGVGELASIDSVEAVTAALERARATDVVLRLENGLDTPLGISHRDGAQLSGGQWQKLALGRAMMRETPLLLVLDEPTAALDAEAEHVLFERYAEGARRAALRNGGITVLVSHRFSTVQMADLILVVEGGSVSEIGTHDQLIGTGGLYAELYGLQAAAYR